MIVLDASVVVEVLLQSDEGLLIQERILDQSETCHVPHLLDVEVAQVVRRYSLKGEITSDRGEQMLGDLSVLPVERHSHTFFLFRIWELRLNLTAYDAVYVALAEALGAPLLTRDERLAHASGYGAKIELL